MKSSRAVAFHSLQRWRRSLGFADKIVAETFLRSSLDASDRAFALELFYGVLRNLTLLDFWIVQLRSEPLDPDARDLLRLGLYQIMFLETAPHAAVYETVELAPRHARKLINAILRRALREKSGLTSAADAQPPAVRYSEPGFLIEKWSRQFGTEAALELCRWNNRPAPVYARVNRLKTTVPEFLQRYPGSFLVPESASFVGLPHPAAAAQSGDSYIQDPSTTLACDLLQPSPGEAVLDACAAPGGKTGYLAEMMSNQGTLIAVDHDEARMARLQDNLGRLGASNARTVMCDWTDARSIEASGLERHSFDKILLDAPCTNTGVMRRRVDVRWRLRPNDFPRMARQQLAILQAVAPFLKPEGSLVYSTCSLEPEENGEVVKAFLEEHPDFRLTDSEESMPFRGKFDGAFAASCRRGAVQA